MAVQRVVRGCERCQSIDPAPVEHVPGEICVKDNWKRLAIDVTHYRQLPYLTIVDCGPSRYATWKELRRETAESIVARLNELFLERGPVEELLMDNATVFKSEVMDSLIRKWKVQRFFRAAYRPSGNGIVERHHRTIKAMSERGGISPLEAVFWYNMTPRSGQDKATVPHMGLFKYEWRHPETEPRSKGEQEISTLRLGDEVWIKPPNARCTVQWRKGVVTAINSRNNVSVDGVPRHVVDIR